MKFFGLIVKVVAKQSKAVVGLITNHAFLDNPTFRAFRWNSLSNFAEIYILDLHGNSKKKEQVPEGYANENVFDIQQGVGRSGAENGLSCWRGQGRGNYVDGSHTPNSCYGQELLPISEGWVPVGRTVLWRRLPFCLRLATES